ncbi:chorismate mutase [Mycolicibacterium celeriflavum]|uniref:Chorismate mutase n=1 Tax=Mycolicibacterium celeriflavum TaxID=1249101 RepID=A0A7I7RN20_MYCCF|nr:chorismate mutase [Mycolicibacterium celeriflavum]MCV7237461.1 chorismate mutase [Mycolicibacterium celeriflavum]BBY45903.1 secreted chorismate mutase [Mycolicibacterium celeriflavum]
MTLNRCALLVAATLLLAISQAPAHAQPASPLYRLVDTAAQRLAPADPVAAAKWLNGGPITDRPRADAVLDAVAADAAAHAVDPSYVRMVFTDQIDATEGIQYTRFAQWKFDPSSAPTAAPDLAESRSQIDGLNKTMVDEIALQWNWLGNPGCMRTLKDASDAVANARQLEPLYRQALSAATRSYCRIT